MGATSVTGKGLGSAVGSQKGPKHLTIGAEKVIGPRVVYAGNHTLSGTGLTIELPALAGDAGDYVVFANDTDAAAAAATAASLAITSDATTLTLIGASGSTVAVMVVKAGLAV